MSEKGKGGRRSVESQIHDKLAKDPDFRKQLLANPSAAIESVVGTKLPQGVSVRVVEESPREIVVVVPPAGGQALSEQELESVAGGGSWSSCTGELTCYGPTC